MNASIFLERFEHVIRCDRVSGLEVAAFIRRGPVWRYADRVQFACPRLIAHRSQ